MSTVGFGAKKAFRDYKKAITKDEKARGQKQKLLDEDGTKQEKKTRNAFVENLKKALKKSMQSGNLEEANKIDTAIKTLEKRAIPTGGRKGNKPGFPRGQWVDVLDRVDVNKHAIEGNWTRLGQDVVVNQEVTACRLMIPVIPAGDYDFEIQFSRLNETPNAVWKQAVAIVPITHSASCLVWFHRDGWSGIDRINGKRPGDLRNNDSSVKIKMENNRRYSAVISVRHHPKQEATIRVSLDNIPIIVWRGPADAVSLNPDWKHLWPGGTLGIGAHCTQTVFHSARIRML